MKQLSDELTARIQRLWDSLTTRVGWTISAWTTPYSVFAEIRDFMNDDEDGLLDDGEDEAEAEVAERHTGWPGHGEVLVPANSLPAADYDALPPESQRFFLRVADPITPPGE